MNNIPNLMRRINEELWNDIEDYIRQPKELNGLDENMICIISSVLRFKGEIIIPDFLIHVPETLRWLENPNETVLSPKLGMFVTELPVTLKNQSLFLLFPAVPSNIPKCWEVDQNISGLVERLTTKEGADELRKVLDKQESSTKRLSKGSMIYPDFFELENDLPVEQMLRIICVQLFEPDVASQLNISPENLCFGARHRAYFKVTPKNIIAGAVDMIFEKDHESFKFKSIEDTNCSEWKNSFVSLIYDRVRRTILFIGIINKNIELPEVSKREAQRYFV
ncbi:unnamed protein product [Lasius platythorax]|uniref:Uncharacterized protein n=2 Tax=Lasius platythorax TaxID=488582 RepID=A0AAV2NGE2_9HYME